MRKYIRPELDTLEFDVDDVITVSSSPVDPGGSGGSGESDNPSGSEVENTYGGAGGFDETPPDGWF